MRPRSASSEVEEPSEEALLEQELARLQRSYRVMQNDYWAYKEDTKKKIQKQKMLISALECERVELDTELSKMKTKQNRERDSNNTAKLEELAYNEKEIIEEIKQERMQQQNLSQQILEVEKKICDQRKKMGGTHNGTAKSMAAQKRKCVLENRLDKAVVHFNKQLSINRQLRDDIDHLRRERAVFENLYKKLARQLENCKREMQDVIETTTQAFEQRDEATNKMVALKERSDKDKQQHAIEIADLQRTIDHDEKVKEFMGVKNNERLELKAEESAKKNRHGADRGLNADRETIREYREAFAKITDVTGETDIEVIVDTFIKKEKENFALFNYVNELNCDVEKLQDELGGIRDEMEAFKLEDSQLDTGRSTLIRALEEDQSQVSGEARRADSNLKRVNKVLDELRTDLESMFKLLSCDPRPIREMLGGDSGITNKTLMIYMGQIEQRATQLINMLHYAKLKKAELMGVPMEHDTPAKATVSHEYHANINAPSVWDERELDEEEESEEPLTEQELRARVTRTLRHQPPLHVTPTRHDTNAGAGQAKHGGVDKRRKNNARAK